MPSSNDSDPNTVVQGVFGDRDVYDLHGRVSAIESDREHLATKNDITSLKLWLALSVLGLVVSLVGSTALLFFRIAVLMK